MTEGLSEADFFAGLNLPSIHTRLEWAEKSRKRREYLDRKREEAFNRELVLKKKREYNAANRDRNREYRVANITRKMLQAAKRRATAKGLPFNLSQNYLDSLYAETAGYCPALGVRLEIGEGHAKANSPSLDRIVPELGYVEGNVVIISNRANSIKNDATPAELRQIADFVALKLQQLQQH